MVADHVRSALMIMADGVTPANEGRGYVLRRLLRRVVRSIRLLGYQDASLPELLPVSRDAMAPSYPEVDADFERISTYAYAEEETFAADPAGGHRDPGHRGPGDQAGRRRDAARASRRSSCTTPTGSRST